MHWTHDSDCIIMLKWKHDECMILCLDYASLVWMLAILFFFLFRIKYFFFSIWQSFILYLKIISVAVAYW